MSYVECNDIHFQGIMHGRVYVTHFTLIQLKLSNLFFNHN